jgi:hypothetical protein
MTPTLLMMLTLAVTPVHLVTDGYPDTLRVREVLDQAGRANPMLPAPMKATLMGMGGLLGLSR